MIASLIAGFGGIGAGLLWIWTGLTHVRFMNKIDKFKKRTPGVNKSLDMTVGHVFGPLALLFSWCVLRKTSPGYKPNVISRKIKDYIEPSRIEAEYELSRGKELISESLSLWAMMDNIKDNQFDRDLLSSTAKTKFEEAEELLGYSTAQNEFEIEFDKMFCRWKTIAKREGKIYLDPPAWSGMQRKIDWGF